MKQLRFSTVILALLLGALATVTLLLLIPAFQGAQSALLKEVQLTHDHDRDVLQQYLNRYLQTAATYAESISQQDNLIRLIEQAKDTDTTNLLAERLSGSAGDSIHAFTVQRANQTSLEVFNTSLLGSYLPLQQLSDMYAGDGNWITQIIPPGRNNTQQQVLRISFPVISSNYGEVIATLHSFILVNDNYQILSEIQRLTGARSVALMHEGVILSGLSLTPEFRDTFSKPLADNAFNADFENIVTHNHQLQLSGNETLSIRYITPNESFTTLYNIYTRDLTIALVAVLLIGLITVMLILRLTKRSLTALVHYADQIAESGESVSFEPGKFHEFNRLGHTLERMVVQLSEHEQQINGIINNTPNIIFIKGADLHYQMVSPNYSQLANIPAEEVIGKTDSELYHPQHAQFLRQSDTEVIQRRTSQQIEFSLNSPQGKRHFLSTKFPLLDENDYVYAIGGIVTDITDMKQAEERLQLSGEIFEQAGEAILVLDENFQALSANSACLQLTGYQENETQAFAKRLLGESPEIYRAFKEQHRWQGEQQVRRNDGTSIAVWLSANTIRTEDSAPRYAIIFSDISALRDAETKLQRLSHYDPLTGLPNRSLFFDRLDSALARSRREESITALLFLNIDRFKNINDAYGHAVGDELLIAAAKRISAQIRPDDTVSRLGGDEFGVILQSVHDVETVTYISHRIQDALRAPFQLDEFSSTAPVSIGISLYPEDGQESKELLSHADTAMYHVKQKGRNGIQFYDQALNRQAEVQNQLEEDLRRAISDGQIYLDYQPRFSIDGETILSAEALARWNHPQQGMIPPGRFIPLAEQSGLIVELGRYILKSACLAAKAWNTNPFWPMPVSVNLSARQIYDPNLITEIEEALEESGLSPELLELEITETLAIDDLDKVIHKLEQIRDMGIRFSVDDFGTGYSSLIYLKRLPVDTVKIDRSFVMDVPGDRDDENIISAIISMSHSLQLSVVAEGVETREQLAFLKDHGCDEIQGFLLGKPGPASVMAEHAQEHAEEVG